MDEDYEEMGENQGPDDALGEVLREAKENCGEKVNVSKKKQLQLAERKVVAHYYNANKLHTRGGEDR
jgi:hypothetical protein